MTVRLLIADDHEVIRTGLQQLLGNDVKIVAQAANGTECLKLAKRHKPDVILLDVLMPDEDGLQTLEKIRKQVPDSKVVMFSFSDNPTYVARAMVLGAVDYVLKGSRCGVILDAVLAAASGRARHGELDWVTRMMSSREAIEDGEIPLTARESQVLRNVALGLSNKEIGLALGISVETVKEHVQNVLRKLDVKDRTMAAVWMVRKGIV